MNGCFEQACRVQVPTVQTSLQQLLAMERLYDSLNGANWTTKLNWVVREVTFMSDPCDNSWYGVICDDSKRIVGINLSNNQYARL